MNNSTSISIWNGKGDGTFTQGQSYATIPTDGIISVSDLDGDGNADIFVGLGDGEFYGGDEGSPNLAYGLMGNGNGTFQGAPQFGTGEYTGNNLADVTGSGTLDLITNTVNTPYGYPDTVVPAFTVQLGTGKGSFNPVATTITAPASFVLNGTTVTGANTTNADTFAVGDINGDGKADLVFADNGIYSAPFISPQSAMEMEHFRLLRLPPFHRSRPLPISIFRTRLAGFNRQLEKGQQCEPDLLVQ